MISGKITQIFGVTYNSALPFLTSASPKIHVPQRQKRPAPAVLNLQLAHKTAFVGAAIPLERLHRCRVWLCPL